MQLSAAVSIDDHPVEITTSFRTVLSFSLGTNVLDAELVPEHTCHHPICYPKTVGPAMAAGSVQCRFAGSVIRGLCAAAWVR